MQKNRVAIVIAAVIGGLVVVLVGNFAYDKFTEWRFRSAIAPSPTAQPLMTTTTTVAVQAGQTAQQRNDAINALQPGDCLYYTVTDSWGTTYVETVEQVECSSNSSEWRVLSSHEAFSVDTRGEACSGSWIVTEDWTPDDGLNYTYVCLAEV